MKKCRDVAMRAVVSALSISLLAANVEAKQTTKWDIDRVAENCIGAAIGGAILGAILGGASGKKKAGQGAAAGLVVGGATCVILAALNKAEKKRIRRMQEEAAAAGEPVDLDYQDDKGRSKRITVVPEDLPPETFTKKKGKSKDKIKKQADGTLADAGNARICRLLHTRVDVEGKGTADLPAQKVCRDEEGNWAPV